MEGVLGGIRGKKYNKGTKIRGGVPLFFLPTKEKMLPSHSVLTRLRALCGQEGLPYSQGVSCWTEPPPRKQMCSVSSSCIPWKMEKHVLWEAGDTPEPWGECDMPGPWRA